MTLRLLIACGAAETTGALIAGDEIVRFFFAPARGDEALPRAAEAGDIVLGRIKTASPALGGAFVDIGAGADAFLPDAKGAETPPEGATAIFGVRRPALGGKGAVLTPAWRKGLTAQQARSLSAEAGPPRLLSRGIDPAHLIARRAAAVGAPVIIVDRPEAQHALAEGGVAAACDETTVRAAGVEEAIARSLEPVVALPAGARLLIDETAGGAVADINAGGAANTSRKPNDAVNALAARHLFGELSRRSIGGRVIIDFLPPSSPAKRQALLTSLAEGARYYERRIGRLAPDGLLDLTAPRRDLSLLERASEEAGEGLIRRGRRLTIDWTAKRAVAALEQRLERYPRLRFTLEAGPRLAAYMEERPQWLARLEGRFGARISLNAAEGPAGIFDVREI